MPMMLTLIEAIAGHAKAAAVARDLGLSTWNANHASGAFKFTRPFHAESLTQTDLIVYFFLCFRNRTSHIAVADGKLDRDKACISVTVNKSRSGYRLYLCNLF